MNTSKNHRHTVRVLSTAVLALLGAMTLTACGDNSNSKSESEKTDHVWKDKTGAIDKARAVQRQLDESRK